MAITSPMAGFLALLLALTLFHAAFAQQQSQQTDSASSHSRQTIRRYNLTIEYAEAAPDGFTKRIITINGQMPGPLIWSEEGDRLIITVTNNLYTEGISIHWHGQHQRGTPYMDGTTGITQCAILPGRTFTYDFTTDLAGTYWYHSHSDVQYPEGLLGPMVVYAKHDELKGQYDEEIVVMLQDWLHIPALDLLTQTMENKLYIIPAATFFGPQIPSSLLSSVLINGKGWHFSPLIPSTEAPFDPTVPQNVTQFNVKHGKKYLFRIINGASISELQFFVHNHSQEIVEVDATRVKPVRSQNGLELNVGQRYSFILTANQSVGNYFIQVPLPDVYGVPLLENYFSIAVLHYEGAPDAVLPEAGGAWNWPLLDVTPPVDVDQTKQLIPLARTPLPKNGRVDKRFNLTVTVHEQRFYINNQTFMMPSGNYIVDRWLNKPVPQDIPHLDINYGDVVEVALFSHAVLDPNSANHPFHLHGHNFWILGRGMGDDINTTQLNYVNPMYRDTEIIPINPDPSNPQRGWLLLRFVADNPGVWHFHCHMEWHLTMGLAIIFNEALDRLPSPPPNTPLCDVQFSQVYNRH